MRKIQLRGVPMAAFCIRRKIVRPEAALELITQKKIADPGGENVLTVKMEGDMATIEMDGSIGKNWWDDSGITAKEFNEALKTIPAGKPILLRINSEGGSVQEGLGIYDSIKARSDSITARIVGYALSVASVFPLAAARVQSPDNSIWMVHEGWMNSTGNKRDHRKDADMLETHDKTMAAIYCKKTGDPESEWAAKMEAETWMTGAEAIECGLADETGDEEEEPNAKNRRPVFSEYLAACHNIPSNIFNMISAPPKGAASTPTSTQKDNIIMNRAKMLALLKSWGVETNDQMTDEQIVALVEKGKPQAAAAAPAAPVTTATAGAISREEFDAVKNQLAAANKKRIEDKVLQYVADGKITNAEAPIYVSAALDKEAETFKILDEKEAVISGGSPIAWLDTGIRDTDPQAREGLTGLPGPKSEMLQNIHTAHKTPQARHSAIKSEYHNLLRQALIKDGKTGRRDVFAANTYSGTLVTNFLMDGAITDLTNVWAPFKAFSLASFCDPYKPLATGQMKHVTAAEAAQTGTSAPATFEPATGSTVNPITVSMNWVNQPMRVGASDLNNGLRMEDLRVKAVASFADAVTVLATAPITAANFIATPLIQTASAFGLSDSATLQGQLQKSPIKNLILAGPYLARIANQPGFFQKTGEGLQDAEGYKPFGWDGIYLASNWSGAGNNVQGFACNPQAIVRATGLPLNPPNIPGGVFITTTFEIPGCEAACAMSMWFSLATRTMFVSFDIICGFAAADLTAGVVIASGTPS